MEKLRENGSIWLKVKLEHHLDDLQSESVENIKFGRNKEYRLILILKSKSFIKYLQFGSWREIKWEELGFQETKFLHILCFYLDKTVQFVMMTFVLSRRLLLLIRLANVPGN